uniref:pleckstrin homology domain-containing family G member 5-like isoform X2 n=2 Tax=Myxine glutinosa TaxID=7769 RepID=UPI00358FC519
MSQPERRPVSSMLFYRLGGMRGIEESVGVCSRGGRKEERSEKMEDMKVPERDWFTLQIDVDGYRTAEAIPVASHKHIRDVLNQVLCRKHLNMEQLEVFLDGSSTPLPLDFDCFLLRGQRAVVRAKAWGQIRSKRTRKIGTLPLLRFLKTQSLNNSNRSSSACISLQSNSSQLPLQEDAGLNVSKEGDHCSVSHSNDSRGQNEVIPDEDGRVISDLSEMQQLTPRRRRKNMAEYLGDAMITLESGDSQGGVAGGGTMPIKQKPLFSDPGTLVKDQADRLEILKSRLSSYELYGLPSTRLSGLEPGTTNLSLPTSWTDICDGHQNFRQREMQQQEALWELLSTEVSYIKTLQVVTDIFILCLLDLQKCGFLKEVNPNKLFINIQQLLALHQAFWKQRLRPVLEQCQKNRSGIDPTLLQDSFNSFGEQFEPYLAYCMGEENSQEYLRVLIRESDLFRVFLTWAESQKQCSRLKLNDMLAAPHQRLTKYPLLLNAVLKKSREEDCPILSALVKEVEVFITWVNNEMLRQQQQQRMEAVLDWIEGYEVVESGSEEIDRILMEFSQLDLSLPVLGSETSRSLLYESGLKLRDGRDKVDVHCLLFSDLLLITKPTRKGEKTKIIRPPLPLDRLVFRELRDPGAFLVVCLNEFNTVSTAVALQGSSASCSQDWQEALINAQVGLATTRSAALENSSDSDPSFGRVSTTALTYNMMARKGTQAPKLVVTSTVGPWLDDTEFLRSMDTGAGFPEGGVRRARSCMAHYGRRHMPAALAKHVMEDQKALPKFPNYHPKQWKPLQMLLPTGSVFNWTSDTCLPDDHAREQPKAFGKPCYGMLSHSQSLLDVSSESTTSVSGLAMTKSASGSDLLPIVSGSSHDCCDQQQGISNPANGGNCQKQTDTDGTHTELRKENVALSENVEPALSMKPDTTLLQSSCKCENVRPQRSPADGPMSKATLNGARGAECDNGGLPWSSGH